VRPTASGERLLGHARRILALQDEIATLLADPAGTASIRIGMPDDIVTARMSRTFAAFSEQRREVRLDVTTGLSRDLTRRYRAGEFDLVVVKEPTASADRHACFPEPVGWFESATAPDWPDPVPLVAFPAGGLYREAMFERIERERRRWYVAFTGSSLDSVLVAVEAGLGLSLVPVGATRGRRVRPHAGLGPEPALVVSLYAWETTGQVAELAALMAAVLAERYADSGAP
jgi:DNA-binding transcriptional LysR family regulator